MYYTLNIGLQSPTVGTVNPARLLDAMTRKGLIVVRSVIHDSLRPPVMVALVLAVGSTDAVKRNVHSLAALLGQDYIAIRADGFQELIGPSPKPFDPAEFILLDGTTMSEVTA